MRGGGGGGGRGASMCARTVNFKILPLNFFKDSYSFRRGSVFVF